MRRKFTYFTEIQASLGIGLLKAILSVLLTSCASAPTVVHDAVGPGLARQQDGNGFLTVYSATAWMSDSDGPSLLNYTDYEIRDADGTLYQTVQNEDEVEPARVFLPEGRYLIEAQSDTSGTVKVPVAIKAGRTTILHLERDKDWSAPSQESLVRLPNGQPIGFRAQTAERRKAS